MLSTHLSWGAGATAARLREALAIERLAVRLVGDDPDSPTPGRGVDPVVLGGDFNTTRSADPLRYLCGEAVVAGRSTHWLDAWEAAGEGPGATSVPSDPFALHTARANGMAFPTGLPDRRIDHVLVRGWPYGRPGCPEAAVVVGDRAVPTADGPQWPSDHRFVVADLRT